MKKLGSILVVSFALGGCSTVPSTQPHTEAASTAPSVVAGAGVSSGISLSPTYRWHGAILRAGLRSDKQCPSYCYNQHTHILNHGSEETRLSMIQECVALCKGLRNDYAGSPRFPAWRIGKRS